MRRENNNCCIKKIHIYSSLWILTKQLKNERNLIKLLPLNNTERNKLRYQAKAKMQLTSVLKQKCTWYRNHCPPHFGYFSQIKVSSRTSFALYFLAWIWDFKILHRCSFNQDKLHFRSVFFEYFYLRLLRLFFST